jgi:hypothetical protein
MFVEAAVTGEQLVFGGLGRRNRRIKKDVVALPLPKPALSAEGLLLRAWDRDDAQVVLAGGDDELVSRYRYSLPHTAEDHSGGSRDARRPSGRGEVGACDRRARRTSGLCRTGRHRPCNATVRYWLLPPDMKVFATGMRQPWRLAFPAGSAVPVRHRPGPGQAGEHPEEGAGFHPARAQRSELRLLERQLGRRGQVHEVRDTLQGPGTAHRSGRARDHRQPPVSVRVRIRPHHQGPVDAAERRRPDDPVDRVQARDIRRPRDERRAGSTSADWPPAPARDACSGSSRNAIPTKGRRLGGAPAVSKPRGPLSPGVRRVCGV